MVHQVIFPRIRIASFLFVALIASVVGGCDIAKPVVDNVPGSGCSSESLGLRSISARLAPESYGVEQGSALIVLTDSSVGAPTLFRHEIGQEGFTKLVEAVQGRGILYPRWSPEGNRIVYAEVTSDHTARLILIDADGSNRRVLTSLGPIDAHPRWSPDGTRILYRGGLAMTVVDTTGTESPIFFTQGRPVFDGDSLRLDMATAQWADGGEYLFVLGEIDNRVSQGDKGSVSIYKLEIDTKTIVERLATVSFERRSGFDITSDGVLALFSYVAENGTGQIAFLKTNDSIVHIVTSGVNDAFPRWTSDESAFVFYRASADDLTRGIPHVSRVSDLAEAKPLIDFELAWPDNYDLFVIPRSTDVEDPCERK